VDIPSFLDAFAIDEENVTASLKDCYQPNARYAQTPNSMLHHIIRHHSVHICAGKHLRNPSPGCPSRKMENQFTRLWCSRVGDFIGRCCSHFHPAFFPLQRCRNLRSKGSGDAWLESFLRYHDGLRSQADDRETLRHWDAVKGAPAASGTKLSSATRPRSG